MAVYKRGKIWWYKFIWNGEPVRESTKQSNKRLAEQIEATHKASLAKGEVGIRERTKAPTLRQFADDDFLPFIRSTFAAKPKTLSYYVNGLKNLCVHERLADSPLDSITSETIAGYVAKRREAGLMVSSINRELQVIRRMFLLAQEWGKVDKVLPRVRMLPGERHRDRVLTPAQEQIYLEHAPPLLHAVAVILLDCGLRPEECFRLKWEDNVRDDGIEVQYGKSENARRRIPVSIRVAAVLKTLRTGANGSPWVFPAPTKSGHIEPSSVKKQHLRACNGSGKNSGSRLEPFPLYTLRHTCLTRWAPHMDPWTLAKLAGHRDMAITKRYIHPADETVRAAIEKARSAQGGHKNGHSADLGR